MTFMKMTWEEIEKKYDQEWVELVDYDWREDEPFPRSGSLRSHAAKKKEFYQQCCREPKPQDSAILFVGRPRIPKRVVFSPSLVRIEPCAK